MTSQPTTRHDLDPLADVIHRAMDRVGVRCYDLAHAIYRDGWRQERIKEEKA